MKFTKLLKKTPYEIAITIKNYIIKKEIYNNIFESIKIINPGFINFTYKKKYIF